jgi:hypothetical protein
MMAFPPVAIMVPRPTVTLIMGHTILIAERASVFTNRATKIVSTMVYSPMKIIITIVGKAKPRRDPALHF